MMCGSDNDIDLTTYCNDQYNYQLMWLGEDLFLCKSVARGGGVFPPFFDPITPKIPYHRNLYHLMVWIIVVEPQTG